MLRARSTIFDHRKGLTDWLGFLACSPVGLIFLSRSLHKPSKVSPNAENQLAVHHTAASVYMWYN